jgi:phage tail-like protein
MPRNDPYRNFRFRVEIGGIAPTAFSEVQIGATTTDVVEYREGTDPSHVRKLSGLTRYGNITLKWGMTSSRELSDWHRQIVTGQLANSRRQVVIVVQDESGADQARFVVSEAWPVRYEVGTLDARGNEVLIELLELANEGIERVA